MIRCRVCEREHEASTKVCPCGADLAIDGVAIGTDARFGDTDLGDSLPDLGALPDLDVSLPDFPVDDSLTDLIAIPADPPPAEPTAPPAGPADPPPLAARDDGDGAADPTEPTIVAPKPKPQPSRREGFAVQPTADSGDSGRGEARTTPKVREAAPSPLDEVPTAPIVDDTEHSVFHDGEWEAGSLRDELDITRAGGVRDCPDCGREVTADSRFCRCGHQFAFAVRTEVEAPPEPSAFTSLWRRITGTAKNNRGDARTWGQRARDTGARRGMRYAQRLSGRTRLGRMGMLLAGGAGAVMVLGPLRSQVKDLPDLFAASQPSQIEEWSPGECDAAARDVPSRPWQSQWPSDETATSDGECPVFDTITGTFPRPVDIDRITIEIGPTSGQPNATQLNIGQPVMSPEVVLLTFTHGGDREPTAVPPIELADTAESQEFGRSVNDATGFTLTIESTRDRGESWVELEIVQIAQLAFFTD
jgi:hypothetical protein